MGLEFKCLVFKAPLYLGNLFMTIMLPDNFVFELFSLSPSSEACEAEAVIAARHDAKPGLGLWLLHDDLHADAAGLVLGTGHGEGQLHVSLKLAHARLKQE